MDQYKSLNDAQSLHPGLAPGPTEVWYAKEFGRVRAQDVDPKDLSKTHALVGKIQETDLDTVYGLMQGNMWSPRGEARTLINSLGLHHTSMSVGDVIVKNGVAHFVNPAGFKELVAASLYPTLAKVLGARKYAVPKIFEEKKGLKVSQTKLNEIEKKFKEKALHDIERDGGNWTLDNSHELGEYAFDLEMEYKIDGLAEHLIQLAENERL